MRLEILTLRALALATPAGAIQQPAFPARDAADYVGRTVTLEGVVKGVRVAANGTVFVDLERKWPRQAISAVTVAASPARRAELTGLIDKKVRITGVVSRTTRGIEMLLELPSQLTAAPEPPRNPC